MFLLGLLVGSIVGTMFGVFIIALCQAASRGDEMFGRKDDTYFG